MKISIGHGGWVAVTDLSVPGTLYLRFRLVGDRYKPQELYLDAGSTSEGLDGGDLRHLPLDAIEAVVNDNPIQLVNRQDLPSPDLSTLASYFSTRFFNMEKQVAAGNWVATSFATQTSEAPYKKYLRVRKKAETDANRVTVESEFCLTSGPKAGLTDEFLRDVARAYRAAMLRGEKPNVSIQQQLGGDDAGFPLKTVQRWVHTARQRGIMPKGKKGKAS